MYGPVISKICPVVEKLLRWCQEMLTICSEMFYVPLTALPDSSEEEDYRVFPLFSLVFFKYNGVPPQ